MMRGGLLNDQDFPQSLCATTHILYSFRTHTHMYMFFCRTCDVACIVPCTAALLQLFSSSHRIRESSAGNKIHGNGVCAFARYILLSSRLVSNSNDVGSLSLSRRSQNARLFLFSSQITLYGNNLFIIVGGYVMLEFFCNPSIYFCPCVAAACRRNRICVVLRYFYE